jgi:hypothetical protein
MHRHRATVKLLGTIVACLSISACAPLIVPTNYQVKPPSDAMKIPLAVKLEVSDAFAKCMFVGNKGGNEAVIAIGAALVSGAKQALSGVFQEVLFPPYPATSRESTVDAVITPEIIEVENRLTGNPPSSKWESHITIKWTVEKPNGDVLYMNTIRGESPYRAFTTAFSYSGALYKAMILVLQDHFERLGKDLRATDWWANVKREARLIDPP